MNWLKKWLSKDKEIKQVSEPELLFEQDNIESQQQDKLTEDESVEVFLTVSS